jgi:hypothetical protein
MSASYILSCSSIPRADKLLGVLKFNFFQCNRVRDGIHSTGPLFPVNSMSLAVKDGITREFKEGLLRPKRDPFIMRVKVGTWREISAFYEPVGLTAGWVRWIRLPSEIDEFAGVVGKVEIKHEDRPPSVWAVDCSCLLISGLDPAEDDLAISEFKRTSPGWATDEVYQRIFSHPRPLVAAFSVNQELVDNPILVMAIHCFAEAFFGQFGD